MDSASGPGKDGKSLEDDYRERVSAGDTAPDLRALFRAHPDATAEDRLKILLDDQQRRWENGQPRPVRDYLEEHPDLAANTEFAVELIYGEIKLRRARGESFDPNDYLAAFPDHSEALERQFFVDSWGSETTVIDPSKLPGGPGAATATATAAAAAPAPALHRFPDALDLDDYQLGRLLSTDRGNMGAVYQARQLSLGRLVAVKFLKPGNASPEAIEQFHEEARAAAQLTHPHIVRIHGVGHSPDRGDFLVMDFIAGVNLEDRLQTSPLELKRAAEIVADVADAIEHAHARNVIHCDLKPGNILINAEGQVMVTDFGLAKRLDPSQLEKERSDLIRGTAPYMAPEQVDERWGPLGRCTDVYGLGGLLYACLTGKPPFQGQGRVLVEILRQVASPEAAPPVRTHRGDVPEALAAICTRCLAKDPARRFGSAASVAAELRTWSARQVVGIEGLSPPLNNDFWEDLLELIKEGKVIPVVGAGVVTRGDDQALFYPWLARRLAERLGISPETGTRAMNLNDVATAYLLKRGNSNTLYTLLQRILRDECPPPGQSLLDLASISAFNLYLTTTFDPLLRRAIDSVRQDSAGDTLDLAFSPMAEVKDLPARRRELPGTRVFYLLGKCSKKPDYVVWEEDMLEFLLALNHHMPVMQLLGRDLREHGLLVLGLNFSDWLVRFFLRVSKQEPLSTLRVHRAYLTDAPDDFTPQSLVLFFGAVSTDIHVICQDPVAFCAELARRWKKDHPEEDRRGLAPQ
jgi:serine/threonine protein kinase